MVGRIEPDQRVSVRSPSSRSVMAMASIVLVGLLTSCTSVELTNERTSSPQAPSTVAPTATRTRTHAATASPATAEPSPTRSSTTPAPGEPTGREAVTLELAAGGDLGLTLAGFVERWNQATSDLDEFRIEDQRFEFGFSSSRQANFSLRTAASGSDILAILGQLASERSEPTPGPQRRISTVAFVWNRLPRPAEGPDLGPGVRVAGFRALVQAVEPGLGAAAAEAILEQLAFPSDAPTTERDRQLGRDGLVYRLIEADGRFLYLTVRAAP